MNRRRAARLFCWIKILSFLIDRAFFINLERLDFGWLIVNIILECVSLWSFTGLQACVLFSYFMNGSLGSMNYHLWICHLRSCIIIVDYRFWFRCYLLIRLFILLFELFHALVLRHRIRIRRLAYRIVTIAVTTFFVNFSIVHLFMHHFYFIIDLLYLGSQLYNLGALQLWDINYLLLYLV